MKGVVHFLATHGLGILIPSALISWLIAAIKGQNEPEDYGRYFICALIPLIGFIVSFFKWNSKDENAIPCLWASGLGFVANIIVIFIIINS